jgi:hypothetical protein
MKPDDPRYADFPAETGVAQLRWMIERVADGRLPVEELIANFRKLHETIEDQGRPEYRSKDEARLIWDVLWSLEFYSTDRLKEKHPFEWNDAADVLAVVQRVHSELKDA